MGNGIIQPSFTAGELAPSLYGRVDLNRYYTGLRKCENFIVRQFGGVSNRPGTKFVADLTESCRLIPFQFSTVQTYVLAFGNYTMRIFTNGGQVVYPVGHAQAGQPVVIGTLYPVAALPRLKFTQNADVMTICHPDYPPQQLSRTDHHIWNFGPFLNVEGPFLDINVDTTKTIYASGVNGNVTLTATTAMFDTTMVGRMLYIEQSPDASTRKWEVQKSIAVNDIRRAGANYYRAVSGGTTGTVRPDHTEGVANDGDPGVAWEYLHSGFGIVEITGYTSSTSLSATVLKRLPDLVVTATSTKNITGLTPGNGVSTNVRITIIAHGFANGESVNIQGVTGTTGANGTWQIIVVDANTFDLSGCVDNSSYTGGGTAARSATALPTYKWALEAWGGGEKYPACTTYYQQRQCFAASAGKPQTTWMSRTKGYLDFGTSNPILDDDSLNFTVASREVNEIRHMIELSELILLTSGGEWVIRGGQDGTLTPSTVNVKRQGHGGSSHIAPVVVDSHALFVQEKGFQLRTLGYSFQQDAFVGQDLTVLASHLFLGKTLVDMAYQRVPFSCVWAVRDDGTLLGLTYMPDQDVAGWHRHTTDGQFKSVCCVSEGGEDAVYFVVQRTINGATKHYVERMVSRLFATAADYFFVDSGLSYSGAAATTISNLGHLEGKSVAILADGNVHPSRVVTGGSITLNYAAAKVHVGLPYTADLETLSISSNQQNIRDKQKLINHVSLMIEEGSKIRVGPDANHLTESMIASNGAGIVDIRVQARWEKAGNVLIRHTDPLPLTILAVIPEVNVGGS